MLQFGSPAPALTTFFPCQHFMVQHWLLPCLVYHLFYCFPFQHGWSWTCSFFWQLLWLLLRMVTPICATVLVDLASTQDAPVRFVVWPDILATRIIPLPSTGSLLLSGIYCDGPFLPHPLWIVILLGSVFQHVARYRSLGNSNVYKVAGIVLFLFGWMLTCYYLTEISSPLMLFICTIQFASCDACIHHISTFLACYPFCILWILSWQEFCLRAFGRGLPLP